MNNEEVEGERGSKLKYGLAALIAIIVLIAGSLWLVLGQGKEQQLLPMLPSPTAPTYSPIQEPDTVAFTKLNDNPGDYLNQWILVTGDYLPSEPAACPAGVGPNIRWSLTADNLQLDALGFERIVRLLPAGTPMTIQGIWRLYQGPMGCGKGPSRGSAWYLETKKIIQPNPLVSEGSQLTPVEIRNATLELPPLIPTLQGTVIAPTSNGIITTETMEGTIEATATEPTQFVPTETPFLPVDFTPSATPFLTTTAVGPTSTPLASPSAATTTGTSTAVATDNPEIGTPTFTPDTPPLPPTATSIVGYPGPGTVVPTSTPSPDPYP